MKSLIYYNYFIFIFLNLIFLPNPSISQNILNNTGDIEIKGKGPQYIEKLENYLHKFSSVKSFILTDTNIKKYLSQNNLTLIYIHSACSKESHDFIPTIKYILNIIITKITILKW